MTIDVTHCALRIHKWLPPSVGHVIARYVQSLKPDPAAVRRWPPYPLGGRTSARTGSRLVVSPGVERDRDYPRRFGGDLRHLGRLNPGRRIPSWVETISNTSSKDFALFPKCCFKERKTAPMWHCASSISLQIRKHTKIIEPAIFGQRYRLGSEVPTLGKSHFYMFPQASAVSYEVSVSTTR